MYKFSKNVHVYVHVVERLSHSYVSICTYMYIYMYIGELMYAHSN